MLSDDEINLLSLLLRRHGPRAIIAVMGLASDRQAGEFAEEGSFRRERRWREYADFFRALAVLITERHPST